MKKSKTVQPMFEEVIICHELGDEEDEDINEEAKFDNTNATRQMQESKIYEEKFFGVVGIFTNIVIWKKINLF